MRKFINVLCTMRVFTMSCCTLSVFGPGECRPEPNDQHLERPSVCTVLVKLPVYRSAAVLEERFYSVEYVTPRYVFHGFSQLKSNTLDTKSSLSKAIIPSGRWSTMSGHLGLRVNVINGSGLPYFRTIAIASW